MRTALTALALLLAAPAAAAPPAPPPSLPAAEPTVAPALAERAAQLVPFFNGSGDPVALFHASFLAQVPAEKMRGIAGEVVASLGPAVRVASIKPTDATTATVTIAHARGLLTLRLVVEPGAPQRIVGLLITGTSSAEASIPAVITALQALPARTGFGLYELGAGTPRLLAGHQAETPLATGSTFKLVILAELVRQIETGERRWEDTVTLDGRELPAGGFNKLPKGTTVPIRGLAEQMISVSDNSATDLLLFALGREKVEAMQRTLGIADPARNIPFLSTMEAFKLKGIAPLRERWLAADARGRRAMLPEVEAAPTAGLATLFADGKPVVPDRIEWFYSPRDLALTMDWLRRHSERGPAAEARRVLAINSGIGAAASRFGYAGYKGGSEPGVMSMTLLLQRKDGGWRVVTGSWENPAAAVDNARFAGLISRAAELAAD